MWKECKQRSKLREAQASLKTNTTTQQQDQAIPICFNLCHVLHHQRASTSSPLLSTVKLPPNTTGQQRTGNNTACSAQQAESCQEKGPVGCPGTRHRLHLSAAMGHQKDTATSLSLLKFSSGPCSSKVEMLKERWPWDPRGRAELSRCSPNSFLTPLFFPNKTLKS